MASVNQAAQSTYYLLPAACHLINIHSVSTGR